MRVASQDASRNRERIADLVGTPGVGLFHQLFE